MGLFGPPTGPCYFCDGKVTSGQNGTHCNQCETFVHATCMKRHGLVAKDKKIIRSDRVHLHCPACGNEGTIKV